MAGAFLPPHAAHIRDMDPILSNIYQTSKEEYISHTTNVLQTRLVAENFPKRLVRHSEHSLDVVHDSVGGGYVVLDDGRLDASADHEVC